MFTLTTILTSIGAGFSILTFLLALAPSNSAPQQAALAAISLGFILIPYCINGLVWRSQMLRNISREGNR
jgi:hypothetical protein